MPKIEKMELSGDEKVTTKEMSPPGEGENRNPCKGVSSQKNGQNWQNRKITALKPWF